MYCIKKFMYFIKKFKYFIKKQIIHRYTPYQALETYLYNWPVPQLACYLRTACVFILHFLLNH